MNNKTNKKDYGRYKIISDSPYQNLCQAPFSWCNGCLLCEEHKHWEKIGEDGLTDTERILKDCPHKNHKRELICLRNRQIISFLLILLFAFLISDSSIENVTIHNFLYLPLVVSCGVYLISFIEYISIKSNSPKL